MGKYVRFNFATKIVCPGRLIPRFLNKNPINISVNQVITFNFSTSLRLEQDGPKGPVKFTSSAAYRMPGTVFNEKSEDDFAYQPLFVGGSVLAFLIYFCILREENDVDQKLTGNQYDKVEGLEKTDLMTCIKYYEENGLDPTDLKKRLEEVLEEEKLKKKKTESSVEETTATSIEE